MCPHLPILLPEFFQSLQVDSNLTHADGIRELAHCCQGLSEDVVEAGNVRIRIQSAHHARDIDRVHPRKHVPERCVADLLLVDCETAEMLDVDGQRALGKCLDDTGQLGVEAEEVEVEVCFADDVAEGHCSVSVAAETVKRPDVEEKEGY